MDAEWWEKESEMIDEIVLGMIDKELAGDMVVPREAAARIVADLIKNRPRVLIGFLMNRAVNLISDEVRLLLNRDRSLAFRDPDSQIGRFSQLQAAIKEDRAEAGLLLDQFFRPGIKGAQKRLRDMNCEDLSAVAEVYEGRAEMLNRRGAFFRVLARKGGNRTVGEVFTEEQVHTTYDGFVSRIGYIAEQIIEVAPSLP